MSAWTQEELARARRYSARTVDRITSPGARSTTIELVPRAN